MRRVVLPLLAALTGAGCTQTAGTAAGRPGLDEEAGAVIETASFAAATVNNIEVMNGTRDYTAVLARRFAAEVPNTVNFPFNSDSLGPEARDILDRQAHWMRQFPELRYAVYGHTDLVGGPAYNHHIGERRARAVVHYLSTRGVPRSSLVALVSFGETQPLVISDTPERANRRTVTEVAGFLNRYPVGLNGKYAEVVFRDYVASATAPSTVGDNGAATFATDG